MLSVIIPSYREPYLQQTIDSLLENAEGEIEIIAVLDGYWPNPPLKDDPRVHILHFGKNVGRRAATNAGVALSKGEYIMKTDAHCVFGPGFDRILLENIEDNWVVIPRRYKLDVEKWEVTDEKPTDYDKLIIMESRNKFHGQEWLSRTKKNRKLMIDETMSFQGSCYLMSRKWWDTIGDMQEEGYGTFAMEPVEIAMETFVHGGKCMVNKKTWYAHKHRKFNRTHNVSRESADAGNAYALEKWKDVYPKMKEYFAL